MRSREYRVNDKYLLALSHFKKETNTSIEYAKKNFRLFFFSHFLFVNFARRDSYNRQIVMTIRLISIMIITDIKINSMIRADKSYRTDLDRNHSSERNQRYDRQSEEKNRRSPDNNIYSIHRIFFWDENDDFYWKMREDDQIEEIKIISRRIFVQASLRSLFKYIHEMRRSSLRVSSIDQYLSSNFQSINFESEKEKVSEVR